MAGKKKISRTPRMKTVCGRIERWRQTRTKLSPMPEQLWVDAVALARQHGVYATAVGLGIGYQSIRNRLKATEGTKKRRPGASTGAKASSSGFVELPPASAPVGLAPTAGAVLEMTGTRGQRLTLRLSGTETSALVELVRACWSQRK